jgi:hypothetical protein
MRAQAVATRMLFLNESRRAWVCHASSYQAKVRPLIGNCGSTASLNENRISRKLGRYRKTRNSPK